MRQLVALLISVILLAPALSKAQTTPSIIGTLSWVLNPGVTSESTTIQPMNWQDLCGYPFAPYPSCSVTGTGTFVAMKATVTSIGGDNYNFSGNGTFMLYENGNSDARTDIIPVMGSMYLAGGQYQMMIMTTMYGGVFNCQLSITTLSGTYYSKGFKSPIRLAIQ